MGFKLSFRKFNNLFEGIKIKIGSSFKKEELANQKKNLT